MPASEEWFDVVDIHDQVVRKALRDEVHQLGLLHRAVHIWIFHPAGNLLIQQRSLLKDRHPGVWDSSASGHLDSGEHYDTAATRETAEELGIHRVPPLTTLGKVPASNETDQEFVTLYHAVHSGPFHPDPAEVSAIRWITPDDLTQEILETPQNFAPCFRFLWDTFRPKTKNL